MVVQRVFSIGGFSGSTALKDWLEGALEIFASKNGLRDIRMNFLPNK
jgi:hypothetical protein